MSDFKRFHLHRDADISGVSGPGIVTEGVQFSDGSVALKWITTPSGAGFYQSIADVEAIHGHQGNTRVVWLD